MKHYQPQRELREHYERVTAHDVQFQSIAVSKFTWWCFQKYGNSGSLHCLPELAVFPGLCQMTLQHFSEPALKDVLKWTNLTSLSCKSNFQGQLLRVTKLPVPHRCIIIVPSKGFCLLFWKPCTIWRLQEAHGHYQLKWMRWPSLVTC